jgi:manganese transport protein
MEGFLNLRIRPWLRRIVTRGIALVPAVVVIAAAGDQGLYRLLILSQVVLSLQLPFATIPLIHFTSDPDKMGVFANRTWVKVCAWAIAAIIVALNLKLVFDELSGWLGSSPAWLWVLVMIPLTLVLAILAYITFGPVFRPGRKWDETITTDAHRVAGTLAPVHIKHIGVALQHAAGDGVIISSAMAEAKVHHAKITLLHAVDAPGTLMLGHESWSLHGAEDESYLESLAREIEENDLPVEVMLLNGQPAEAIVKAVDETGMDMLVMGSHGHRGLDDLVFGQTVSAVRHAVDIPVLLVRSYGRERAQRSRQKPEGSRSGVAKGLQ